MFGENLKALRKQKGFSQEELASRLHVVRQTVSKWEKNLSLSKKLKSSIFSGGMYVGKNTFCRPSVRAKRVRAGRRQGNSA